MAINDETNRHNVATEIENNRHNLATEEDTDVLNMETNRHNLITEAESQRHNKAGEQVSRDSLRESKRSNRAVEKETRRHNKASEKKQIQVAKISAAATKSAAATSARATKYSADRAASASKYATQIKAISDAQKRVNDLKINKAKNLNSKQIAILNSETSKVIKQMEVAMNDKNISQKDRDTLQKTITQARIAKKSNETKMWTDFYSDLTGIVGIIGKIARIHGK